MEYLHVLLGIIVGWQDKFLNRRHSTVAKTITFNPWCQLEGMGHCIQCIQKIRYPHIFCQPLFFVKNHKSLPIFATFQERVLSMWICSKLTIRTPERTRDPILYFFLTFLSVKYNEKKTALTVYWLVSRKRSNIAKNVFDHFMVKWSNTLNKNLEKIFSNPGKQLFWSNWKKWKFGFWGFKSVCMFSSTSFMSLSLKESWCHHREIVFLRMFLFL